MRINLRTIAIAAVAVLLAPSLTLLAEETPSGGVKDGKSADAAVSSSGEPGVPMAASSQAPAADYSGGMSLNTPKVEIFLGYSYLRAVPTLAAGNRFVYLNGGSASIAFNFNRYLGLVGDFGDYNDSQLRLNGDLSPGVVVNSSGNAYTYLFGPRLSFRGHGRLTPFAQVLVGGVHASDVTISGGCTGTGCTPLPAETKLALTAGGGLDVGLSRHIALRLIQAEYLMTRFNDNTTGASASQNDVRLSAGLVFRFGGGPPPPPPAPPAALTYSCSANPSSAFPGDAIVVTGSAMNILPGRTAVYTWSADGGAITGTSSTANIDTKGLAPGTYHARGNVSEGGKPGESADCSAAFTIRAFEGPTVSCSANPSTVTSGASSSITASGMSPQNRTLTYSYTSTSGTVSGSGTTATLSTAGAATGAITVNCNVVDDLGQTATAPATVTVVSPVAAAAPTTSALCSISFDRDARRPARVDNDAKACLDGIALNLQQSSDAKIALVGSAGSDEKGGKRLAAERATNTKAYLVKEKGIDSSRITTYTGSESGKTVSTTLIPAGATFDANGDTAIE